MWWSRRQVIQNKIVAKNFQHYFSTEPGRLRSLSPDKLAMDYARHVWGDSDGKSGLAGRAQSRRARFHVCLAVRNTGLPSLTKRAALVSDTLLLTHSRHEADVFHQMGTYHSLIGADHGDGFTAMSQAGHFAKLKVGFHCPSLEDLGQWIADAEPLLRSGLAWYLPRYEMETYETYSDRESNSKIEAKCNTIDSPRYLSPAARFLVDSGRAVDASGIHPNTSRIVRPILEINLPFLEGVGLRDFSDITISEFDAYSGFREFLRCKLLEVDDALNVVQSDRELMKIAAEITDQVRGIGSQMRTVRRRRSVAASGAAVGAVGAVLAAVYGPAFEEALKLIGVGSGLWGVIDAAAGNSTRQLREDKWYYVWALSQKTGSSDGPIDQILW